MSTVFVLTDFRFEISDIVGVFATPRLAMRAAARAYINSSFTWYGPNPAFGLPDWSEKGVLETRDSNHGFELRIIPTHLTTEVAILDNYYETLKELREDKERPKHWKVHPWLEFSV